jgi:hypothetical protein
VSGNIYPFVISDQSDYTEVESVDFYLDGKYVRTEDNPPHDFGSGSVSTARLWVTTTVSDGQHTIEAHLFLTDGSTTSASATFVVANSQSEPTPTATPLPTATALPTEDPTEEPTAPETVNFSLMYSLSRDRTDPANLDGATVSGSIYPYVVSDQPDFAAVVSVDFYLDGEHFQTEENPPHDFGSGSVSSARPWNTTTVPDGQHIIAAVLVLHDGSTASVSAQFTVANETSAP